MLFSEWTGPETGIPLGVALQVDAVLLLKTRRCAANGMRKLYHNL